MKSIIDWLFGIESKDSREVATNRMKLMVIHDRAQLPAEVMTQLKAELMTVMSKYFEVDPKEADFMIETHEQFASIVTNGPLRVKADIKAENLGNDNGSSTKKNNKGKNSKDLSAALS